MKQQTFLYIQEPCHENWNQMSPEEQGRFCHSCAQSVTDFSLMTDAEILKRLASGTAGCGRFATDQLQRAIQTPAGPAKKKRLAYLLSFFLPLFAAGKLNAQKSTGDKARTEQAEKKPGKLQQQALADSVATGTVTDTAKIKNSGQSSDGTPLSGDLPLQPMIMGLIIEYDKVKTTDTISTYVKKATGNELFSVYPNPGVRGKRLSIRVKEPGVYTIHFMDMQSKMIVYKNVTVGTKDQIVFLDIPARIAQGNYYLRFIQQGNNKQFVDKVLIR